MDKTIIDDAEAAGFMINPQGGIHVGGNVYVDDRLVKFAQLRAQRAAGNVPDGYVLVPIEPTEEMIQAACLEQALGEFDSYAAWWNSHSSAISERIRVLLVKDYKAMLAAAPTHPTEGQEGNGL